MITLEINDTAVNAALNAAAGVLGDLTPVMQDIGEALALSTKRRFGQGVSPDGIKWAAKSPVTLAMSKDPRPLFGPSGDLSQLISYEASAEAALISSPKKYAAMMHFGGKKEQFPHLWGDIPARPFFGLSADDRDEILETISDALTAALSGN